MTNAGSRKRAAVAIRRLSGRTRAELIARDVASAFACMMGPHGERAGPGNGPARSIRAKSLGGNLLGGRVFDHLRNFFRRGGAREELLRRIVDHATDRRRQE